MHNLLYPHRSNAAIQCKKMTNRMESLYLTHYLSLDHTDQVYYADYIQNCNELFATGQFDILGDLKYESWNKYNVRYGYDSINGTTIEMMSHVIRNESNSIERSHSYTGTKQDEVQGRDGIIYNKSWANSIYNQIKRLNIDTSNDTIILQKNRHFPDNYENNFHRLTLVDIDNNYFIELDYSALWHEVKNEPDSDIIQRSKRDIILLPISKIKHRSKFRYSKIWL